MKNKTIVITGAGNGIGRAWALKFHQEKAHVVAADIDIKSLESLSDIGISTKNVDVRDSTQVRELITDTQSKTGRVDVLFNNAGIAFGPKLENARQGKFEDHIAVHLFGCIYGMRAAIPIMRYQAYGRIINTVSRNAEFDVPGTSAYSAAKSAIWAAS